MRTLTWSLMRTCSLLVKFRCHYNFGIIISPPADTFSAPTIWPGLLWSFSRKINVFSSTQLQILSSSKVLFLSFVSSFFSFFFRRTFCWARQWWAIHLAEDILFFWKMFFSLIYPFLFCDSTGWADDRHGPGCSEVSVGGANECDERRAKHRAYIAQVGRWRRNVKWMIFFWTNAEKLLAVKKSLK